MSDPREGVSLDGTIQTGAARHRVPERYEPMLRELVTATAEHCNVSLYLYGSVANGTAQSPTSDVDVLTIDLDADIANDLSAQLSGRYGALCSRVDIGAVPHDVVTAANDEGYGFGVFLRHYCIHLAGPDLRPEHDFAADQRAARGFNGDIGEHLTRWRRLIGTGTDAEVLGRRVARKTLLAAAGIASVSDQTWTTGRANGASWWAAHEPGDADDAELLLAWASDTAAATAGELAAAVTGGVVEHIAVHFASTIGLWRP